MTYRSILAYLPSPARTPQIWKCAATLAQAHEAHLTAMVVSPDFVAPYAFGAELPPQYFETPQEVLIAEVEAIRKITDSIAHEKGLEAEWRHVEGVRSLVADVVVEHAMSADLVVMPQATGEEWGAWAEIPERVILNSGRPVVVVPETLSVDTHPTRIMVAWTDSPQSARATFDAVPLMRKAESVEVVSVRTAGSGEVKRSLSVDQVALALARHDIKVAAATDVREDMAVGEAILEHARERHADSLVMGCYGHSRYREALLGGVSRTILRDLSLPVLMAH